MLGSLEVRAGSGEVLEVRGALHLELLTEVPEPAPRTNLRAELTSFVGRDAELAEVAGLLRARRLLTLTGPGGAGKTRLAVEAARAELPAAPDGVWLVELAPVTDPAEVPSAALAVGLIAPAQVMAQRLQAKLVVRNCYCMTEASTPYDLLREVPE